MLQIEALKRLKENGHKIFLCSGRSYNDVDSFYYDLPIDGLIAGGGAHVILSNKEEYYKPMPRKELDYLTSYLFENNVGFA